MKPLKLVLQAFGPFVDKQTVDFEKLSKAGMFLIKGDTGSGKTTIFDAMTFALYGGSSGNDEKSKNGRNDLEEWRCNQAPDELDTFVSFTFDSKGTKYVFTRGLKMKRKNLSAYYEAGTILEDGTVSPFFENPKKDALTQKAEELVGLSKEQFRQVILLPQGQFERFLLAGSNEKEEILTKIFSSERWAAYAGRFYDAVKKRKDEFDDIKREIDNALNEEGASDLDALEGVITGLQEEKEAKELAHRAFDGEKKQEELNADLLLSGEFRTLHGLEKEKVDLTGKADEIEQKRREYEEAEKAEPFRNLIEKFEEAQKNLSVRVKRLENAEKDLPKKEKASNDAEEKFKKHAEASPVEENTRKIGEYEGKINVYTDYDGLKNAEVNCQKEYDEAKKVESGARIGFEKATEAAKEKKRVFDEADLAARNYRDRYFAGIYGEISAELKEGEPCPICGSVDHPNPAVRKSDSVSKPELDKKEAEVETAKTEWQSAESLREESEREYKDADALFRGKENAYKDAAAKRESAQMQLIDGIVDLAALKERITALKRENERYAKDEQMLKDAFAAASQALTTAVETVRNAADEKKNADEKLELIRQDLDNKLTENGYSDLSAAQKALRSADERTKLHEEIVGYETSVKDNDAKLTAKEAELAGKAEPDSEEFDGRQKEIKEEAKLFAAEDERLKNEIERLGKRLETLKRKKERYDGGIKQAEDDLGFARKLRGDAGTGLPRYVLAVMFGQVIAEANRMLEIVHGGRYRLLRTGDKGVGNKRGLELKVHDSRSPEKDGRSVAMLSGGEKFLVSLALSIGMSAIAQTTGVQIEALFIDEGFGTLDEKSIGDAMNVLDSVQKSNGVIGIISHVSMLEENIPTQLEVIKTSAGSRIRLQ